MKKSQLSAEKDRNKEERRSGSGWREVEEAVVQYAAISPRVQEEARKYARRAATIVAGSMLANRQTSNQMMCNYRIKCNYLYRRTTTLYSSF